MMNPQLQYTIQSTAGAVPVRNEKGEISMQKVKVHRYVSGKKPEYAQDAQSESDEDEEDFLERRNHLPTIPSPEPVRSDEEINDPRLRRLKEIETEVRPERRRHVHEPEVLESSEDEVMSDTDTILPEQKHMLEAGPDDDESEAELSDSEIERKREMLKKKILITKEDEFMVKEEEKEDSESEESSEYEEYTDSEEETGISFALPYLHFIIVILEYFKSKTLT
nr:unnamed protein product [Callosobruchus chinensis]